MVAKNEAAVALRAFFRIADRWKLTPVECAALLATSRSSIARWTTNTEPAKLTRDQVERISYILGIYVDLHAILGESPYADAWVRQANTEFAGAAPLARMLSGNVTDLADVRLYVAWRSDA